MLDRTLTPELKQIEKIAFIKPNEVVINDFVSLFYLDKVSDETVRLEFHFNGGQIQGDKNLSNFVSSMLLSGTKDKTSEQIHEELDYLGAYVDHEISMEGAFVSLFCLRKNLNQAIEILVDAIQHVVFHEHELNDTLQEKKQRYLLSLEKVNFLARKEFQKHLFANSGKYLRQLEVSDFENVNQEDLANFHKDFYLHGLKKVILVGNLEQKEIENIVKLVSPWANKEKITYCSTLKNNSGEFHIEKKGAVQTAIRVGIPLFNKKNSDFFSFQILQTILGDYFGSRLMSNIREDKGYTYGIGCALVEMKETGYFVIATEVAKEVTLETIKEIKHEIEVLKNEHVSQEELDLVKNYMLGQLLKSADGPNAMMDLFLGVHQHHLELNFYNEYIQKIKNITVEELKNLANKYLIWENFTIVTAGEHN